MSFPPGSGSPLPWDFDPREALRRWPGDRRVLMLHSGRYDARWARGSILAQPVGTYRYLATSHDEPRGLSQWDGDPWAVPAERFTHKPFHDLRLLPRKDVLWIGYLSYDLGRWIERLPALAHDDRHWPIIEMSLCPGWLVYDAQKKQWSAHGTWNQETNPLSPRERAGVRGNNPPRPIAQKSVTNDPPSPGHQGGRLLPRGEVMEPPFRATPPISVFTRAQYERAVQRVKDYIAAGDVFQVNLAQRFTCEFHGESPTAQRALFDRLSSISPAWYGAYLESPDGRVLASTSPELFLEVTGRRVVTRPIKGTRPASAPADELRDSEKDKAELNMIVDLLRNDLGRVCAYGSVRVTQPRVIETHPTVHHGVATIEGQIHERKDLFDLLRATMPGGSITGAPKVRAMQIIDELEPVRRGPYCGAIGYFQGDDCCFNIAIRTMLIDTSSHRLDFSVGGGIVADSDPAMEYDETLDKAAAMLKALGVQVNQPGVVAGA